jgi:hypothetical protein
VLLLATGIGETEVNKLDFVFFHHLHHVCNGLGHQVLLGKALVEKKICLNKAGSVPAGFLAHYNGATHTWKHHQSPKSTISVHLRIAG